MIGLTIGLACIQFSVRRPILRLSQFKAPRCSEETKRQGRV